MNFELTQDQQQIRDTFARFCDERIAPQAAALDEAKQYPRALFQELADLGFFGMRYPEEVGGSGTALTEFCLALQEVARGSMSLAGAVAMQSLMGTKFLQLLGGRDQRRGVPCRPTAGQNDVHRLRVPISAGTIVDTFAFR